MISAAVVLYNTKKQDLENIIKSFAPCEDRRLILIDNANDEYAKEFVSDWINYIKNDSNLGYGAAHNIGIRRAFEMKSKYHVILNPDVSFNPSVIDALERYLDEHPSIVYALPKVFYPNGEIQYLCKLLPTPFDLIIRRFLPQTKYVKKRNDNYVLKKSDYNKIINPPCLSGCFMFLRTETLHEHDLMFDERFFVYCEDFDLIRRLHRVGETIFYPSVSIVHNHEKESYKSIKMLWIHIRSACSYFNKYGWFIDKERQQQNAKIMREIDDLYQ